MALTRSQKETLVKEMSSAINDSQSVAFVNFHGVPVEESNGLRGTMRKAGVRMKVAKKTLLKYVLGQSSIEGEVPALDGEVAVAYGDDLIAPAREAYAFQKEHADSFKIIGGIFEGRFQNQEEMTEIATIPSEHQLRGMFVNVINSPIQGLAVALGQIAEQREAA